jgi:ADP-ribose pyrophosphatase YjhB (NUDIX family)
MALTPERLAHLAEELRGMAQNGLLYSQDRFDIERYQRIRDIAAECFAALTGVPAEAFSEEFSRHPGYATPKVGVAAAIFDEQGRMFLIQRADNRQWAMPGGWADIGLSAAAVAVKEAREETGLDIEITRLLGLFDGRANQFTNVYHLYHVVFAARVVGGALRLAPDEALDAKWYSADELPELTPGHDRAILDAFARYASPDAYFDRP